MMENPAPNWQHTKYKEFEVSWIPIPRIDYKIDGMKQQTCSDAEEFSKKIAEGEIKMVQFPFPEDHDYRTVCVYQDGLTLYFWPHVWGSFKSRIDGFVTTLQSAHLIPQSVMEVTLRIIEWKDALYEFKTRTNEANSSDNV